MLEVITLKQLLLQDAILGVAVALILAPLVWRWVCWYEKKCQQNARMKANIRAKIIN